MLRFHRVNHGAGRPGRERDRARTALQCQDLRPGQLDDAHPVATYTVPDRWFTALEREHTGLREPVLRDLARDRRFAP